MLGSGRTGGSGRGGRHLFAALLALALALPAVPGPAAPPPKASERQSLDRERTDLQGQISSIQRDISLKEQRLTRINDELRKSEQAIARSAATLRDLAQSKNQVERQLEELAREAERLSDDTREAEATVATISRAQFLNLSRHPWRSALTGANPNDISRRSALLSYLAHGQDRALTLLAERRARVDDLTERTNRKRDELARIERSERDNSKRLEEERQARQVASAQLNSELSSQRERVEQLTRNERELTRVIAELDRRLAAARRAEEEKRRQEQRQAAEARARAQAQAQAQAGKAAPSAPAPETVVASPVGTRFSSLKGRLTMPTQGTVAARFGQRREGAAAGIPWRGLLIRAKAGQNVVATAPGTVLFSDWMRGYGNLIILDHGSDYLSVYANNESLFKSVGDKVRQGEAVASVGNSGGERLPGLYFELRYKNRPVDPGPWLAR